MASVPAAFPTKVLLTLETVGGTNICMCLKDETFSMNVFHSMF